MSSPWLQFISRTPTRVALMAAALLVVPACDGGGGEGGTSGDDRVDAILALTPDSANGAAVYMDNCGADICHGADGSSGPAADLATAAVQLSDSQLVTVILDGQGNMPPLGLPDQSVADVVAYLNETFM